MRISILSILIALAVVIAGPIAFAGQDQTAEQETATSETITETVEVEEVAEGTKEDCANGADDDGDSKVDCDDADCAEDANCKGGY